MENRNSNRHKTDQSIVCTVFSSHGLNDMSYGKLKNYGVVCYGTGLKYLAIL